MASSVAVASPLCHKDRLSHLEVTLQQLESLILPLDERLRLEIEAGSFDGIHEVAKRTEAMREIVSCVRECACDADAEGVIRDYNEWVQSSGHRYGLLGMDEDAGRFL